jgi:thioredoxin-dependent peroxiredoxin
MTTRRGAVVLEDREFTALGAELEPGDPAPDAVLHTRGFAPELLRLSDYRGRVLILSCVPSLDTSVCARETVRWEEERKAIPSVEMLTVSMDLPNAQARWCGANDVDHRTASAHMNDDFGRSYGVLIEENRLLQRAVFVIDPDGVIQYAEYLREVEQEPDYSQVLAMARRVADTSEVASA